MGGPYPGTHVHTADNAVPPINDDLAGLIQDLRGFSPALDMFADAAHALAVERLTVQQTQTAVTMLAGSTDQPGQQIDVLALIAALVARLLNADENPCLRALPADVQAQARTTGTEFAEADAYITPRQDLAKTVYDLNPL